MLEARLRLKSVINIRNLSWCPEERVFGIEVMMDDITIVEILRSLHDGTHATTSVIEAARCKTIPRTAHGRHPVEKIASAAQVKDSVHVVQCLDMLVRLAHFGNVQ